MIILDPREIDLECCNCGYQFNGFYDPDSDGIDCQKCGSDDVEMN